MRTPSTMQCIVDGVKAANMEFNAINFAIFNIPGYFFFTGIGLTVALCIFIILVYTKGYPISVYFYGLPATAICAFFSARLFGVLSGIYCAVGEERKIGLDTISQTGIVFYGGMIGLLVSYAIYIKIVKIDAHILDLVAVVIPLFHAIARIGCFTGGCCFGIEYSGILSIKYTTIIYGKIVTAQRLPVQLIEAVFNLSLFIYLLSRLLNINRKKTNILYRYLLLYAVGRFIIEFFRGDYIRGVILGISFSQVISIIIILSLFIVRCKQRVWKDTYIITGGKQ